MKHSWSRQRRLDEFKTRILAKRLLPRKPRSAVNRHGVIVEPDEVLSISNSEGRLPKLPYATVELTLCVDGWRVGFSVSTNEQGVASGACIYGPAFGTRNEAIKAVIAQCNWHPAKTTAAKQAKRVTAWLEQLLLTGESPSTGV